MFGRNNLDNEKRERHLITDDNASFAFVEAYKSLRTNIDFIANTGNCKTILVTSVEPRDGKSSVSMNLAVAMGDSGKKVILLDCDMRKGTLATYLKVGRNHRGLSNIMADGKGLQEAIINIPDLKIDFLPVGMIPPNPAELLASHMMFSILRALSKAYDYVILDTPPINVVTDAAVLSSIVDGVVLVARANVTTKQSLAIAKQKLDDVNANILGVILNGFDQKNSGYYYKQGYHYDKYYSYGYGEGSKKSKKAKKK